MKKIVLNEQDFVKLRKQGGIYVDKTKRIKEIIEYSRYLFLSRPRRFGKSLLVSTLEALFSGNKSLFKGLWIENNWEWKAYPVIRLDFSKLVTGRDIETIDESINAILTKYAKKYKVAIRGKNPATILNSLIDDIYEETGKGVVILIDEYDNPITSHLSNVTLAERNREYFRDIYQVIKSQSGAIHLVFITGVSKFAKLAIFSAISQMKDISLLEPFNDIVGFTKEELLHNFSDHIQDFATMNQITKEEMVKHITHWYDGYTWDGERHIYNPYSILNAFADKRLDTYWFETGTPDFLIQLVTKHPPFKDTNAPFLQQLDGLPASKKTFDSYNLKEINITAALFQSGYLTIKQKLTRNFKTNYILGFPNYEVRHAFNAHLLKVFTRRDDY